MRSEGEEQLGSPGKSTSIPVQSSASIINCEAFKVVAASLKASQQIKAVLSRLTER
jgi:hypothetical protein